MTPKNQELREEMQGDTYPRTGEPTNDNRTNNNKNTEEEEEEDKRSHIERNPKSRSRGTPDGCDRTRHCWDGTIGDFQNDGIDTPLDLLEISQEGMRSLYLDRVRKLTEVDLQVKAFADYDEDAEDGDFTSTDDSLSAQAVSSSCLLHPPQPETAMSPPSFPLFSPSSTSTSIDTSPLPHPIATSQHSSSSPSDPFDYPCHSYASRPLSPAPTLTANNTSPHLPPIIHVDKNQYLWPATTSSPSSPPLLSPSSSVNTTFTITTVTAPDAFSISAAPFPSFADQERQKEQEVVEEEECLSQSHSYKIMDKGWRAWLVVLASVLIQTFAFAPTEFIFGVFVQEYLHMFPRSNPSSIALIGTIGSSTTYLVGFFSGALSDRWGYRVTSLIGSVIMTTALCLASFSTQVRLTWFIC
jgi:hypothetical protein